MGEEVAASIGDVLAENARLKVYLAQVTERALGAEAELALAKDGATMTHQPSDRRVVYTMPSVAAPPRQEQTPDRCGWGFCFARNWGLTIVRRCV